MKLINSVGKICPRNVTIIRIYSIGLTKQPIHAAQRGGKRESCNARTRLQHARSMTLSVAARTAARSHETVRWMGCFLTCF